MTRLRSLKPGRAGCLMKWDRHDAGHAGQTHAREQRAGGLHRAGEHPLIAAPEVLGRPHRPAPDATTLEREHSQRGCQGHGDEAGSEDREREGQHHRVDKRGRDAVREEHRRGRRQRDAHRIAECAAQLQAGAHHDRARGHRAVAVVGPHPVGDLLGRPERVVDHQHRCHEQPQRDHRVERVAQRLKEQRGAHQGHHHRDRHHQHGACIEQERDQRQQNQTGADQQGELQVAERVGHVRGRAEERGIDLDPVQRGPEVSQCPVDPLGDPGHAGRRQLLHGQHET